MWAQTKGVGIAIVWSGLATAIVGLAIKYTIGWRISEEDEVDGIDFAEHGESAYDLASSSSGSSGTSILTTSKEGVHA